jgi:hypothetical protein
LALSGGAKGTPGAGKSTGAHVHCHDVLPDGTTRARPFTTGGGSSGSAGTGTPAPIPEPALEVSEMKFLYTPAGATTTARYALIDLVAFRSAGGVLTTDVQATAENYSRICPTPAVTVTREEFNASVTAANLFVQQVVNASFASAPAAAAGPSAAEIADAVADEQAERLQA